ncbi:MAG: hypothetical protein ACYCX4_06965 [Bacillota bacterium]
MKPEKELNCKGYYGFGNGYMMGTGQVIMYCNTCKEKEACWMEHRTRIDGLSPAATEYFMKLVEENHGDGQKALKQWLEMTDGQPDPYMHAMAANMVDGNLVASGQMPMDRGKATLPYPFNKKAN